jgi:hypothetical protein
MELGRIMTWAPILPKVILTSILTPIPIFSTSQNTQIFV